MNIDLDLYKTFYTVAKLGSMTKAAENLFTSQPAITRNIRNLEHLLDTTLCIRSNKGITLTNEGLSLFNNLKPAFEIIQNTETSFKEFKDLNRGVIRIGISAILTKCLLFESLKTFKLQYPNIQFQIVNGKTSDLLSMTKNKEVDFTIFADLDNSYEGITITPLTKLNLSFCYNPAFFNLPNVAKLDTILQYPLILQEKSSHTRQHLDFFY